MNFVDFHGFVGDAAFEGKRLAVKQMLIWQVVKLLVEKLLVLSIGFN